MGLPEPVTRHGPSSARWAWSGSTQFFGDERDVDIYDAHLRTVESGTLEGQSELAECQIEGPEILFGAAEKDGTFPRSQSERRD